MVLSVWTLQCCVNQGQTGHKKRKKKLVGCSAWRLPLCLDSTSSSERRTKEEAGAKRGSCWFTMDRVVININYGREQWHKRWWGLPQSLGMMLSLSLDFCIQQNQHSWVICVWHTVSKEFPLKYGSIIQLNRCHKPNYCTNIWSVFLFFSPKKSCIM